ncbi:MAG TPA: hypothetical protein PKJ66_11625, partial [Rhodocyclaceae bacterium]|nr:hypothetical protein [Rhodocyclaceae bacterium]
ADFLMFALDQLSGANALKGLRGKGIAARPFTKVEQLQSRSPGSGLGLGGLYALLDAEYQDSL